VSPWPIDEPEPVVVPLEPFDVSVAEPLEDPIDEPLEPFDVSVAEPLELVP
jgi:hypothetical protein